MIKCQLIVSKIKDKGAFDNARYVISDTENNIRNCSFFVIIIVFVFNYESGEDKGKIRKDQERMVQHIIKNVELQNKEEIKNIKVKNFKKNNTTGSWSSILEINGEFEIMLKEDQLGGEIRVAFYNSNDMKLDNNKKYKEKDVKIQYYG